MAPRADSDPKLRPSGRPTYPPWAYVLAQVRASLHAARPDRDPPAEAATGAVGVLGARAHGRLVRALEGYVTADQAVVADLVGEASELLLAVCDVWRSCRDGDDRRGAVADVLESRLHEHEADVLAGELTYAITCDDAQGPAARLRDALKRLRASSHHDHSDLLSLQAAAVDLAALIVRAAGNLQTTGRGTDAAAEGTAALDRALRSITQEIITAADLVRSASGEVDLVNHYLCAALRVPVSGWTLEVLSSPQRDPPAHSEALNSARGAWLSLAAYEHVAVAALDPELSRPAYAARFATLTDAVSEGAANVLYGGRLVGRPEAFRHRRAWGAQALRLSYAIQAYVRGLRGEREAFAQAQLIVLTRLVRAVAAVAIIDLTTNTPATGNGRLAERPD